MSELVTRKFLKLRIGVLSISCSFQVQTAHRQDRWNQDDETDVLGQNSESAFRQSFSFQVRVVRVSELKFRSFLVC
ncbi:hypothetical protein LINPERPRIM_LOCUS14718 [Linum perenne]